MSWNNCATPYKWSVLHKVLLCLPSFFFLLLSKLNIFFLNSKRLRTMLLARFIFRISRSTHITPNPMLHSLHWLPIEQRIKYKLSLLCFEIISYQAPTYHSDILYLYTPSWQLCSFGENTTSPHKVQWSGLFLFPGFNFLEPTPCFCYHATCVSYSKCSLKTFLFSKTFSSVRWPWYMRACTYMHVYICVDMYSIFVVNIYTC